MMGWEWRWGGFTQVVRFDWLSLAGLGSHMKQALNVSHTVMELMYFAEIEY